MIYGLQLLARMAGWFAGMKHFGVYASPLALPALLLAAYCCARPFFDKCTREAARSLPVVIRRRNVLMFAMS